MDSSSADFISASCGLIFLLYKELWEQFLSSTRFTQTFFFYLPFDFYGCIAASWDVFNG